MTRDARRAMVVQLSSDVLKAAVLNDDERASDDLRRIADLADPDAFALVIITWIDIATYFLGWDAEHPPPPLPPTVPRGLRQIQAVTGANYADSAAWVDAVIRARVRHDDPEFVRLLTAGIESTLDFPYLYTLLRACTDAIRRHILTKSMAPVRSRARLN